MWVKRAIRPLIPDALMARYRVHQHSRAMRTNVDVFVTSDSEARRWLRLTPDTYRVVSSGVPRSGSFAEIVRFGEPDEALINLIGVDGIEVAVRGETLRPAMHGRRVVEPTVVPSSIVAVTQAVAEIGGADDNRVDLVRTLQRFSDAGRRIGLVPNVVDRLPDIVRQPISEPAVVVFAAVPLHDIGGGSRAAQLAFELLRSGFHVTYVALYPSAEGVDLGLRYIHPALEQYRLETFPQPEVAHRASPGIVILEAPADAFLDPVAALKEVGWRVIYDIIDHWRDRSLGGEWYDASTERAVVELADGVTASAPDLVEHGRSMGADPVLVPNAVNRAIFEPAASVVPADLPDGRLIGYHGSLYGDWFDWDALEAVAEGFAADTVVVIGDDRGRPPMPSNVVFLGLKPQADLPAYVQRFAVGLVPFTICDVTHAVSPLKVYEYLASGVPVAAPPLRALEGLTGVYTNVNLVTAVEAALDAPRPDREAALERHSWRERLGRMLATLDVKPPDVEVRDVVVVRRVPLHYGRRERWVR